MRPPRGVRVKEDYRQWAGHEISLEIEDVLDKKRLVWIGFTIALRRKL